MNILERFLKYVSIDTTSNSTKEDTPSTENQRKLAELLVAELIDLNINVNYDTEHCYVYGKLDGDSNLPSIGFVAHLDTSDGAMGANIKPNIIDNYDGKDIKLNDSVVLSVNENPDLKEHIGKTLITSDGTTLLGADDKAGIAEIMDMLQTLSESSEKHGDIYICFTPDEEIGLGTLHIDKNYFKPNFAYTIDGSSLGEFSYENFNAASVSINISGVNAHCGHAKNKMINAIRIASFINSLLPEEFPENTENREGFFHLASLTGDVSNATMKYLIRDFDKEKFEKRKKLFEEIVEKLNRMYDNRIQLTIKDSYRNMLDVVSENDYLINETISAIINAKVAPRILPIRGGTDGTNISYMGIPCPNLGTGGHNFHSIYEYVCLEDMMKVSEVLLSIIRQFSKEKDELKIVKKNKDQ